MKAGGREKQKQEAVSKLAVEFLRMYEHAAELLLGSLR